MEEINNIMSSLDASGAKKPELSADGNQSQEALADYANRLHSLIANNLNAVIGALNSAGIKTAANSSESQVTALLEKGYISKNQKLIENIAALMRKQAGI